MHPLMSVQRTYLCKVNLWTWQRFSETYAAHVQPFAIIYNHTARLRHHRDHLTEVALHPEAYPVPATVELYWVRRNNVYGVLRQKIFDELKVATAATVFQADLREILVVAKRSRLVLSPVRNFPTVCRLTEESRLIWKTGTMGRCLTGVPTCLFRKGSSATGCCHEDPRSPSSTFHKTSLIDRLLLSIWIRPYEDGQGNCQGCRLTSELEFHYSILVIVRRILSSLLFSYSFVIVYK